eukprot:TRINITY_DN39637_c0_g1_i1.p1 TRINITY_DN39637_c0_g1~~TRINITY_DN39637_c0_g1_i1.p1  ORF type:complete len:311 (-),score=40.55 TRINITY_DN39637_c0_g1_i1:385-1317(-)
MALARTSSSLLRLSSSFTSRVSAAFKGRSAAYSTRTAPAVSIPEKEIEQFEADGACVVRGLFSSEWVDSLRAAAEENLRHPGPLCDEHVKEGEPGRFHDDQFLWHRHEEAREFVFKSPAAEIARQMARAKSVRLFYDQLLVKEPGTKTATPWHNDQSYWQLQGNQIVSVCLALDEVPKSSCVKYVKGSHHWKLMHKITSFSGDAVRYEAKEELPDMPNIDDQLDKVELLAWDMEPGDCLVHHGFAVHGASGVSTSGARRRGYATRWVGDDVVFDPRPGTMHYLWLNVGLDPKLKAGQPMESEMFPLAMAA